MRLDQSSLHLHPTLARSRCNPWADQCQFRHETAQFPLPPRARDREISKTELFRLMMSCLLTLIDRVVAWTTMLLQLYAPLALAGFYSVGQSDCLRTLPAELHEYANLAARGLLGASLCLPGRPSF